MPVGGSVDPWIDECKSFDGCHGITDHDTDYVCGSDGKTYTCPCRFYTNNANSVCEDPPSVHIVHQGYCTSKSLQVIFHIYMYIQDVPSIRTQFLISISDLSDCPIKKI